MKLTKDKVVTIQEMRSKLEMLTERESGNDLILIAPKATKIELNTKLSTDDANVILLETLNELYSNYIDYVDVEGMYYALLSMYYECKGSMDNEDVKNIVKVLGEYKQSYVDDGYPPYPDGKFMNRLNKGFIEWAMSQLESYK